MFWMIVVAVAAFVWLRKPARRARTRRRVAAVVRFVQGWFADGSEGRPSVAPIACQAVQSDCTAYDKADVMKSWVALHA